MISMVFLYKYFLDKNNMKKFLLTVSFMASVTLISCNHGKTEETDDKDSISAAKSADSMLQNELNADTSMNTDSTTDNMPTDSMQNNSQKR